MECDVYGHRNYVRHCPLHLWQLLQHRSRSRLAHGGALYFQWSALWGSAQTAGNMADPQQITGDDIMQQQWQDRYFMVQPPQFVSLGPQAFESTVHWILARTAVVGVPGQQAQDAVTRTLALWRTMPSVFQQQQHQVCLAFAPGTPWTSGTPVGHPRYPGFTATPPIFPAPVQGPRLARSLHHSMARTS